MKAAIATLATFALLLALPMLQAPATRADDAAKGDWTPLFNGKDLDGWEHLGPGKMVVEDGVIRTEGGMGLLWYTRKKLGNCVIKVVYKTTNKASNSGVFIRVADKPKDEWYAVHHGYEVQICDGADEFHRTGAIYSLSKATAPPPKAGEWNTMEITLKGDQVIVNVNGVKVNEFDSTKPVPERKKDYEPERGPRPEVGYFGLQNHDDYDRGPNASHVYFKEVSVKPL
jgi:3-keto-disaccharide hydrolase